MPRVTESDDWEAFWYGEDYEPPEDEAQANYGVYPD